ncbi:MAG: hypothetical protein COV67_06790, partial [Nitrospinae bacterium CG11_big_fil_rev_8_21_14_0_20_56_8]
MSALADNISFTFKTSFRSARQGTEELSPPSGFSFTPEGNLVVSDDFKHRIQIFSPDGELIRCFGSQGNRPGEFHYPKGTAVDGAGNIYVADSWNHRIQKFDAQGTPLLAFGTCGENPGELNEPYDIHVEPSGRILVVERYNHRIQFFAPDGKSLGYLGSRGMVLEERLAAMFDTPARILPPPLFEFPTSIARDSRGNYFISDSSNHRILKFDGGWKRLLSIGERGSEPGKFQYCMWVAVGPNDLVYAADLNNDRIQVFSSEGHFVASIGESRGGESLKSPSLVAVGPDGALYTGLTFDTTVSIFIPPSEPQKDLARQRAQGDPDDYFYQDWCARLACLAGDFSSAVKSWAAAVARLHPAKEDSDPGFAAGLLVRLSRCTAQMKSGPEQEALLLKGLEMIDGHLIQARQNLMDAQAVWDKAVPEVTQFVIEQQNRILSDQDDPRVFNKDLFQAEDRERELFRECRRLAFVYRQRADDFADFFSNALRSGLTEPALAALLRLLARRTNELCQLMIGYLEAKEKNEEAMVRLFGEMQDDGKKWATFLPKLHFSRRILGLLIHLQFELHTHIRNFQEVAVHDPQNPLLEEILRDLFIEPPGAHMGTKILMGLQEDWLAHKWIDIHHKNIVDLWAHEWNPPAPAVATGLTADFFSAVPYDFERMELDDLAQGVLLPCLPLKDTPEGLVAANRIFPWTLAENGSDLARRLGEIIASEAQYDEKEDELFAHLKELSLQEQNFHIQLRQVNVTDKKTPITLQNSIFIVGFQISLLRRMILALELNETLNLSRLVIGTALLVESPEGKDSEPSRMHLQKMRDFRDGIANKVTDLFAARKSASFREGELNLERESLNLRNEVGDIQRAEKNREDLFECQFEISRLEIVLDRFSRIRNLLNQILSFVDAGPPSLNFKGSIQKGGALTGQFLQPVGMAFAPSGDLLVTDMEHHRVFRFSGSGDYKGYFGIWGDHPGGFKNPVDVGVDRKGFIYVAEALNPRIQKFSPQGEYLLTMGARENPEFRPGILFSLSIDPGGHIWTADPVHN